MSIANEAVVELIKAGIPDAQVVVDGDGYKYQAEVVSSVFAGLNKVKRHQKVYATVNDVIVSGELHALTLVALTPEEKAAA
ncbi:MAG: BolA family transcriptional regulator [uncultured Thiotrichaceae bacterium]|uniref:BolA family transcriptional regulator n=1 Tax=uncultured Thiotrichaceae bacterium TaxID=298394 RepID=A0A6S6TG60_9GAMM|nr:MAG: BolA family transcriptional regulator [uncultured Thiotrichaceae bacterium]